MTRRAPRVAALSVLTSVAALLVSSALGAASAAPSHFGAPPIGPAVELRVGLEGVGRPGRWLPVVVDVTGGDTPIDGTLDITWGESTVSQPIRLEAGGRVERRVLLRALDASPSVRATLTAGDALAAETSRALQLRAFDETTVVCIGPAQPDCGLTIDRPAAPADWRALDLADEVRWTDPAPPAGDLARELAVWRAMRWWNDSGLADPVLTPPDATGAGASFPVLLFGATALALWLGALTVRRRHPAIAVALPLALGALGTVAVARDRQPAALDTTGTVRQFAGVNSAVVSLRGDVRHGDATVLTAMPVLDALVGPVLSQRADGATRRGALDADGRAVFRARAPRDARTSFTLDATLSRGWLDAQGTGGRVTLRNRSTVALTACRLRADREQPLGDLDAGATIELGDLPAATAAIVACQLPSNWLAWSSPTPVTTTSRAWLVFHFWPGDGLGSRSDDAAR